MEKEFVTFQIAKELKELGFDEPCFGYYIIDRQELITEKWRPYPNRSSWTINSPLWQQSWSFLDANGVIIGIIFVDNVFKYTLNTENYVSNGFKDRMSAIKSATMHATNYLWNKKFNK